MLEQGLKSKINALWDKFWSGGIANPLTAIEQMSYLIFMKRLEDQDNAQVKRSKSQNKAYTSIFDGTFEVSGKKHDKKECRWSEWKHYPAEQMLIHVRDVVFPFIKNLHNGEQTFFSRHMKDAVFLIPKPSLLQEAVSLIDEMNITMRNIDTQGDIYEYLLSELKTSGKNGQFRTPRHIIRMMVELVDPDINDKICDPACGTGGFLINAYEHIVKKHTSPEFIKFDDEGEAHNLVGDKITKREHWDKLWKETFYGYDFDTTMVRIGLMNMILHGIKEPHIDYLDSLSKRNEIKPIYSVVLANPPFTGSIDKDDINDALKVKTTKTELLFMDLFYRQLEMGGRAAVIIPTGVLFGSTNAHKEIRQQLLEKCELEAVISMPGGVFRPYAGVATAIIVFKKGGSTKNVWFYDMKADGYSLDDKRAFIDGKGDIPKVLESYRTKAETAQSIVVPAATIKEHGFNLSSTQYRKTEHEEIKYDTPMEIIDRALAAEREIAKELQELKGDIKVKSQTEYPMVRFGDVAKFLRGPFGSAVKKSVCVPKQDGVFKLYEQGNVINNDFARGNYYLTKQKYEELSKFEIKPGDVLITCAGTLGKIAIVPEDIEPGVFNSVLMRIRLDETKILTKFFVYFFQSPQVQSKISGKSYGAVITNLFATSELRDFEIPLPSIDLQHSIVELVERIEALRRKQNESVAEIGNLFSVLLQKAFKGELIG